MLRPGPGPVKAGTSPRPAWEADTQAYCPGAATADGAVVPPSRSSGCLTRATTGTSPASETGGSNPPGLAADLQAQAQKPQNEVDNYFKVYPVLQFGLAYRF